MLRCPAEQCTDQIARSCEDKDASTSTATLICLELRKRYTGTSDLRSELSCLKPGIETRAWQSDNDKPSGGRSRKLDVPMRSPLLALPSRLLPSLPNHPRSTADLLPKARCASNTVSRRQSSWKARRSSYPLSLPCERALILLQSVLKTMSIQQIEADHPRRLGR